MSVVHNMNCSSEVNLIHILLRAVVYAFLLGSLVSCSPVKPIKDLPPVPSSVTGPDAGVNTDLEIEAKQPQNTFRIGEPVYVDVHLLTNKRVKSAFDVQLFALDDSGLAWMQIEQEPDIVTGTPWFVQQIFVYDQDTRNGAIIIHPMLKLGTTETALLISVSGQLVDEYGVTIGITKAYTITFLHQ